MAKVLLTAKVENGVKWEESFRTHGEVFKTYGLRGPVDFTVSGDDVALCMEPSDVQAFLKTMTDPETVDAMMADGVKRETVKVYVLEKSAY